MNIRVLFFALFSSLWVATSAQYCAKTTVYFDFGKSILTKTTQQQLDSLAKTFGDGNYIVELSGHADSVNTDEYNMKLSMDRNNAVETYLKKKSKKIKITYKDFPHGEFKPLYPNDTEENRAKNRRVEIFVLEVTNDKLVFNGDNNESVEIPADFPGSCSVCEELKISFIHNDKEAADAGISLKSSSGRALTTAGIVNFSFYCHDKATNCVPIQARMQGPSSLRFECLSSWTSAGKGNWSTSNASLERDGGMMTFSNTCYNLGTWMGALKPKEDLCKHQINFPIDLEIQKTKVYSGDSSFYVTSSEMPLTFRCETNNSMFSWAKAEGNYYYLQDNWRKLITKTENTGNCDTVFTYDLTKEKYTEVAKSDTTLLVKFKGFSSISNVGFYIDELELLLPLENVKKTTYTANYLNYDHVLRFSEEKTYDIKYNDVKTKYKKGKKKLKVTVKKKKLPSQ